MSYDKPHRFRWRPMATDSINLRPYTEGRRKVLSENSAKSKLLSGVDSRRLLDGRMVKEARALVERKAFQWKAFRKASSEACQRSLPAKPASETCQRSPTKSQPRCWQLECELFRKPVTESVLTIWKINFLKQFWKSISCKSKNDEIYFLWLPFIGGGKKWKCLWISILDLQIIKTHGSHWDQPFGECSWMLTRFAPQDRRVERFNAHWGTLRHIEAHFHHFVICREVAMPL